MRSAEQVWFASGGVVAMLAVALGAFAAHGLKTRLSPENLSTLEIGARYQMYHGLALLAVAYSAARWGGSLPAVAGVLFIAGIVLFSGSLYVLSLTGIRAFGAVAPVGGLAFLGGWMCLVAAAARG